MLTLPQTCIYMNMYTHKHRNVAHCFPLSVGLNYLLHTNLKYKRRISQTHFKIFYSLTVLYMFSIWPFQFPPHFPSTPPSNPPSYFHALFRCISVLEDRCYLERHRHAPLGRALGNIWSTLVSRLLLCHLCTHLP